MPKAVTELRADFQHLRRWRKSVEQAQGFTFKAVITVIVTGFVGAVWLGIKIMLAKLQLAFGCYEARPMTMADVDVSDTGSKRTRRRDRRSSRRASPAYVFSECPNS